MEGTYKSGSRYRDKQIRDELSAQKKREEEAAAEKAAAEKATARASRQEEADEDYYLDDPYDEMDEVQTRSGSRYEQASTGSSRYEQASTGVSRYEQASTGSSRYAQTPAGSRYASAAGTVNKAAEKEAKTEKQHRSFSQRWDNYRSNLKAKKLGAILGTCAAAAVVAAYIGGAVYFDRHYYPKTEIFGVFCGGATQEELTDAIKAKVGEYKMEVDGRNGLVDVLDASQISLAYTEDGGLRKALKEQQSFIWPIRLLMDKRTNVQIGTGFDEEKAKTAIRGMSVMKNYNQVEPVDAHIGETATMYEVVPEVEGSTLRMDDTVSTVLEALGKGETKINLDELGCYVEPKIRQDDEELNRIVDAKNEILGADITYKFGDNSERVDVKSFIEEGEDGHYHFSEEKIWNYIADMADRHDTFGMHRTFHTSLGSTVELYGGDYGWAINQADTAQLLLEACLNKTVETREPIYNYTAKSYGADDIGGTYVEISISQQYMWCYQDGYLMVETPVVTGNPNKNNATPAGGVWAIDAKMRDYTLVGEGYRAPVNYWMPFNGNVGIHDLTSRGAFGGTIYLYAGSHGCVNTPLDAVSQIYSIVSIGTPVIVYD